MVVKFNPFLHRPYLASEFLPACFNFASKERPLRVHAAIKSKSEKVKCLRLSQSTLCPLSCRISAEFKYLGLFFSKRQSIFLKAFP